MDYQTTDIPLRDGEKTVYFGPPWITTKRLIHTNFVDACGGIPSSNSTKQRRVNLFYLLYLFFSFDYYY